MKIKFNKRYKSKNEKKYILDVLENSEVSGDGDYTRKVINILQKKYNLKNILMTTSCSQALEMAMRILDIKNGDEVILPSYAFTSCANAVLSVGAKVVFARVKLENLTLDEESVKRLITNKTKAILYIHYAGDYGNLKNIMDICKKYNLKLIEDSAQAMGSLYNGKMLGTFGDIGVISFHSTKNITSGEGGMLLINNDELFTKARIIHQKGTNRFDFINGNVNKYEWKGYGVSGAVSEILMAYLLGQIEEIDYINAKRCEIINKYTSVVSNFSDSVVSYSKYKEGINGHIFYILFKNKENMIKFKMFLEEKGIETRTHFVPLHNTEFAKQFKNDFHNYFLEKDIDERVLRLPIYPDLTDDEIIYICKEIENAFIHCCASI